MTWAPEFWVLFSSKGKEGAFNRDLKTHTEVLLRVAHFLENGQSKSFP